MTAGEMPVVTLYGRDGCHLCDEARTGLESLRAGGARFELDEVDIEADPGLHRLYLERIPVVSLDGRVLCELGLDVRRVRESFTAVGILDP